MIGQDCYIPKEAASFFSKDSQKLSKEQVYVLAAHYFGRVIVAPKVEKGFIFLDFRMTPQGRRQAVRSMKDVVEMERLRLEQVVAVEGDAFDDKMFENINSFDRFVDFVSVAITEKFSGANLKLHRIDLIGRCWVVFNTEPSNEWARIRCKPGQSYYARAKFLSVLREVDVDRRFDEFLLVENRIPVR